LDLLFEHRNKLSWLGLAHSGSDAPQQQDERGGLSTH